MRLVSSSSRYENYGPFTIKNSQIYTKQMIKQWSFQFDKRRVVRVSDDDIYTLPYGF